MIDLVIVGAGPAGLTAAIYAARAGLDFVVLEQDGCGGGQITAAHEVENYPGLEKVSGAALGDAFRVQAQALGTAIRYAVVTGVRDCGDHKELLIEGEKNLQARTVIAATGSVPRTLGIPGERELSGAGVSYCAICDGAFFREKDVLVVGGGDTAVEDALYLSSFCRSVTLALRRDIFRAAKRRVDLLKTKDNVTIHYRTRLLEITGSEQVETIVLSGPSGRWESPMDGVFLAVGAAPVSQWLRDLPLVFTEEGYILAGEDCSSGIPGLFVAGDLRKKPLQQVVTAVCDGANAASSAASMIRAGIGS